MKLTDLNWPAFRAFAVRCAVTAVVAILTLLGSQQAGIADPQTAAFVALVATAILQTIQAHANGPAHAPVTIGTTGAGATTTVVQ